LKKPVFSVSGLRGIAGESLTPDIVFNYSKALSKLIGRGEYLVGRDTRRHGEVFKHIAVSALLSEGNKVIDLGIVPTPTLLYLVRKRKSRGGIVITASHNPYEWNALKFVKEGGIFLSQREIYKLKKLLPLRERIDPFRVGDFYRSFRGIEEHIEGILELKWIEEKKYRRIRVAIDCVNGASSRALPLLFLKLGFDIATIRCSEDGNLPKDPEPRKENLEELDRLLKEEKADIGFATDPDGDRLIFGYRGVGLLTEEHTLPLVAYWILSKKRGIVVTNLSTSMMIENICRFFGAELRRTPVGESYVVEEALRTGAILAGEGNGGVIFPQFNCTRDGLLAAYLITGLFLSGKLNEALRIAGKYSMRKLKFRRRKKLKKKLIDTLPQGREVNLSDGVYIRYEGGWAHIRESNTEPVLRVYIEAHDLSYLEDLEKKITLVLKEEGIIAPL